MVITTASLRTLFCASLLLVGLATHAQTNCLSQPPGLVNWWKGDGNALDSVGGKNGTVGGTVGYSSGEVSNSFAFVNGTVNFGTGTANFNNNDFTVEFWLKTTAQVTENFEMAIMEKRPACSAVTGFWGMRMGGTGTGGKLIFEMSGNSAQNQQSVMATRMLNDGIWHHVAVTRASGFVNLYLDGVINASQSNAAVAFITNSAAFIAGQSVCTCCSGTQPLSGYLDEISIYNRALGPSEIAGVYNAGAGGKCVGSVGNPPVITQQPTSITAMTNSFVGFSVSVSGDAPLSYQWSFNSSPITGATNSNYTIASVQQTNAGTYAVFVSNPFGSTQSSNATLTVTTANGTAPTITTPPTSQTVYVGQTAQMSVVASGTAPLSYAWTFNGTAVSSGTSVTIPNAQLTNAGTYAVVVTNAAGSAGASATLTVLTAPPCLAIPGMVAWWPGQSNATDIVSTNNGTIAGGLTYTNGMVGSAYSFNGTDAAVNYNTDVGNFGTNDFTAEFWINTTSTANLQSCIEKHPICNAAHFWDVRIGNCNGCQNAGPGHVVFELYGCPDYTDCGTWVPVTGATPINDGLWHHVACVRIGTNSLLYVDGKLDGMAGTFTGQVADVSNTGMFRAGQNTCQCCDGTVPFKGALDEITLYQRALTSNEVQSIYAAGGAGKCLANAAPVITSQPANIFAAIGSTVNINVGAYGSQPMSYLWNFNGTTTYVTGSSPLVISNVQPSNAGTYFVVVTNVYGSATSSNAVLAVGNGPAISAQPQSQTALQFTPVTFSVSPTGSAPLSIQWQRNGVNITQATNASYTLPSVQTTDAGSYRVVVTNTFGSLTSSNATLTVFIPNVRLENTPLTVGPVTVPLRMVAGGDENSVSTSISWPSNNLIYAGTKLGSNAVGALMTVNTNQIASGRLGVAVFFADSSNFGIGTQELARITFRAGIVTNAVTNTLSFGDVPVVRQVVDSNFNTLVVRYSNAVVTMPVTDYEGDVSPRTNGNHTMSVADWTQAGRFVAGLDTVSNTLEFLRADCAPRTNGGDGRLSIADWVQAGRYAFGFDGIAAIGGPTNFTVAETPKLPTRPVSLVLLSQNGLTNVVAVHVNSQGDENAFGFSLNFDPAQLGFVSASLGGGASGAVFNVNSTQTTNGHVGVAMALTTGNTFSAGDLEVARVTFVSTGFGASYSAGVSFGDQPIVREIADANATTESASYSGTNSFTVSGQPMPQLTATLASVTNIVLSWPAPSTGFNLESVTPVGTNWAPVIYTPATNGGNIVVTQAISVDQMFYRLRHP